MASPSDVASAFAADCIDSGRRPDASGARAALALAGPAEFDRCLRQPAALRAGAFALHVLVHGVAPAGAGESDAHWRLGLVIPKRYEASAVARNTIKRRWRGAFRHGRVAWAGEFGSADVVVRMHGPLVRKADRDAVPARVRARDTFDPTAAFAALASRLRGRSSRAASA